MVPTWLFRKVGGYSEEFPINFNDIDFCYKIAKAGYSIVYEPRAELTHYESVSVVKPLEAIDSEQFLRMWPTPVQDPFYNGQCLNMHPPTFGPASSEPRY